MKALLGKLLLIQKEIDGIAKSDQGFNYSYAGQEAVLNTIRPLMNQHGLLLVQEVLEVENTRIDYTTGKGDYIKEKSEILTSAAQRFTWYDTESGEKLEALFHANGMNDWEKGLGSALTYAERYFLLKFFHIPTPNDDPDARQAASEAPQSAPKVETEGNAVDTARDEVDGVINQLELCTETRQLTELWNKLDEKEKELYETLFTNRKQLINE